MTLAAAFLGLLYLHLSSTPAVADSWTLVVEEDTTPTWSEQYDLHADVEKACASSPHRLPPFEGAQSFFSQLLQPQSHLCYAWLKFGGELNFKTKLISQLGDRCVDGLLAPKHACHNPELRLNASPCLVYAFSLPGQHRFERDMELFSCEVHSFVLYPNKAYEHAQLSKFYHQHSWILADDHRDERVQIEGRFDRTPVGRHLDYRTDRYRTLDFIIRKLGHQNKEIKFAKADGFDSGRLLLKHVFRYRDRFDIKQVAAMLFLAPEDDVKTYEELYKVFEGLACAGYRHVRSAPETVYVKTIHLRHTNQSYHPVYTVNFVKDLNV